MSNKIKNHKTQKPETKPETKPEIAAAPVAVAEKPETTAPDNSAAIAAEIEKLKTENAKLSATKPENKPVDLLSLSPAELLALSAKGKPVEKKPENGMLARIAKRAEITAYIQTALGIDAETLRRIADHAKYTAELFADRNPDKPFYRAFCVFSSMHNDFVAASKYRELNSSLWKTDKKLAAEFTRTIALFCLFVAEIPDAAVLQIQEKDLNILNF